MMSGPPRVRRAPWPYKQTAYTVAILVAIYGTVFVGGPALDLFHEYQERKDLERRRIAERDRLLGAIHEFRERTGRLPKTAEEAGLKRDPELFVSISYRTVDAPDQFSLRCEYHLPGIMLGEFRCWVYESETGQWHDTHVFGSD